MLRLIVELILSISLICSAAADEVIEASVSEPVSEEIVAEKPYSDEDVYWLSRLIYAEAGADSCSDELQLAVGSVVLNRVASDIYPDSILEVIFDADPVVQYGCTTSGMIYLEPDQRAIDNAVYLLENGSQLPGNVLGQADRCHLNYIYMIIDGVVFSSI